jgi:putative ABC transport system ATP-binding protein
MYIGAISYYFLFMAKKKILEIRHVSKSYKSGNGFTEALKDVSFSLDEGESLSVIGPSGSGKSTLLNLIGGLDKPTKGSVIIDGKEIDKLKDSELSHFRNQTIGFVFQFFNLQDYLQAQENVMIPMILSGMDISKAREKASELLAKVGLASREKYFPRQLSGGEMQRVAVARSLANDPKILLADEPTANLDRESANKVMELFEEIAKNGVSVIVITHDPYVSKRFKNIVQISDGKVLDEARRDIGVDTNSTHNS